MDRQWLTQNVLRQIIKYRTELNIEHLLKNYPNSFSTHSILFKIFSTYRAAARKYNVRITTICGKVKNKMPISTKLGL